LVVCVLDLVGSFYAGFLADFVLCCFYKTSFNLTKEVTLSGPKLKYNKVIMYLEKGKFIEK